MRGSLCSEVFLNLASRLCWGLNSLWRGTRTGGSTEEPKWEGSREGGRKEERKGKREGGRREGRQKSNEHLQWRRLGSRPLSRTWRLHSSVVVRVDADVLLLGAEGELTALQGFQLVVGLQVRPAPDPAVDDVGEALPVGHLQPSVQ